MRPVAQAEGLPLGMEPPVFGRAFARPRRRQRLVLAPGEEGHDAPHRRRARAAGPRLASLAARGAEARMHERAAAGAPGPDLPARARLALRAAHHPLAQPTAKSVASNAPPS